jgi:tRNA A-37 threonylcarbamoyl transferase component Bud32
MPTLRSGQVVANRYQVLKLVGQGGMGAIYRCHDKVLKEEVALKTLLPQFAQDKTIVDRFVNEARIARQLSHPNIVRVHDIGVAGDIMYISMEFLEGRSLRSVMESLPAGSRFPVRDILEVVIQICNALEYAHQYTIHRDIKPENIMIMPNRNVKLMDFGISKLMSNTRLTMTSMVMGTPQYMSPEQFRDSGTVDARADVYSLGVLLYEVVTGNVPTGISKPVSQLSRNVPPALDPIVARCLEPDPANRYQSAGELRTEVERLVEIVGTSDTPPPELAAKPATREGGGTVRRVVGFAVALAILSAGAAGAWTYWDSRRAAAPPETVAADASAPPDTPEAASWQRLAERLESAREKASRRGDRSSAGGAFSMAERLRETALQGGEGAYTAAYTALQCYMAVFLAPRDGSMQFVPPGTVDAGEEGESPMWVDGFFVDAAPVSNKEFLDFATEMQWHVPPYLQGGITSELSPGDPVTRVPFYYAQAFAAFYGEAFGVDYSKRFADWREPTPLRGKQIPTGAQWQRISAARATGDLAIDAPGGLKEWTATPATPAEPGPALRVPGQEVAGPVPPFGFEMVVWRSADAAADGAAAKARAPYGAARRDVGFRCVKVLPNSPAAIDRVLQ